MYAYRKLSAAKQQEILNRRKRAGVPWHVPPHYPGGQKLYLITAACRNHAHIMSSPARLEEWERNLHQLISGISEAELRAWVVLPDHYHLLLKVDLALFKRQLGRLHNGTATQWNREDAAEGRSVWFRFSDRIIRSKRHCYASVNYIHFNPVRHDFAKKATDWPWSSIHYYLQDLGRAELEKIWQACPIDRMGEGWDD